MQDIEHNQDLGNEPAKKHLLKKKAIRVGELELPVRDVLAGKQKQEIQKREITNAAKGTKKSDALKGKKPARNANSKLKVNKEAGPISPVLMD